MSPSSGKRYFVETWGCQMNELDSQRLAGQLMQLGMLPVLSAEEADLVLLNSCSVREKAEQKVYSRLGEYRLLKSTRPDLLLGLCGCVAQQEGERALARVPELDFVLGPARVGELREVLRQRALGERVVATGFPPSREYDLDAISRDGLFKGMVTVIEGCDKRCTFCVVPSTRGPERCRPLGEVLAEVDHLVGLGFQEIELLGQTVNHWRDPASDRSFADLLDAVAIRPGVRRLRFVTSYPRDFDDRMIAAFARHPNVASYLHLPVQSGSDEVLRRMGRGYTVAAYEDLIARVRAARPDVTLSTDMIVGFPGESEADFAASLALVERARFANVFAFAYSPRPGTAAPRLDRQIEPQIAAERLQRLMAAQETIQRALQSELVGQQLEVLVTEWGRVADERIARTSCHRIVHVAIGDAVVPLGAFAQVEIDRAFPHSLRGRLVAGSVVAPERRPRLAAVVGAAFAAASA